MLKKALLTKMLMVMLVLIFPLFGCGDDGDDSGNASGMDTLRLSGRVYLENWNENETNVSYSNFTGNLTIDDYLGGSGTVTNGNLSYSVGIPSNLYEIDFEDEFWGYDITSSGAAVQGRFLYGLDTNNGYLEKYSIAPNVRNNSHSWKSEWVEYVYVDNDITITGIGKTETETWTEDGTTYTETYIRRNFNLALKTGWNAIYHKSEGSGTFTGTWQNPTSMTDTTTRTLSLSNPSLRWVLYGYEPPPTIPPANHTPLTFDTWANGNITGSVREQYFRFTATANQHYIHFDPGTLDDVWVEVYDSSGSMVGNRANLYGSYLSSSWNVMSGQTYYIRVRPYYDDSGSYQIAFNSSSTSPLSAKRSVLFIPSFSITDSDVVLEKTKKTKIGIFGQKSKVSNTKP